MNEQGTAIPCTTNAGRHHYTKQALRRDPDYDGAVKVWDEAQAKAILQELFAYFAGSEMPAPPYGLPGRNDEIDQPVLDALQIGFDYFQAVAAGRVGRQWVLYREMRSVLDRQYHRGAAEASDHIVTVAARHSDNRQASVTVVPMPGFAYFIGAEAGPIKIGTAIDPAHRLRGLQTAHHAKLSILATVEGGRDAERAYHEQFAAHRLHGEWFARCPEIEAEIAHLNNSTRAAA